MGLAPGVLNAADLVDGVGLVMVTSNVGVVLVTLEEAAVALEGVAGQTEAGSLCLGPAADMLGASGVESDVLAVTLDLVGVEPMEVAAATDIWELLVLFGCVKVKLEVTSALTFVPLVSGWVVLVPVVACCRSDASSPRLDAVGQLSAASGALIWILFASSLASGGTFRQDSDTTAVIVSGCASEFSESSSISILTTFEIKQP